MLCTNAILINEKDNVVTVTKKVMAGEKVIWLKCGELKSINAVEDIPLFHKVAITRLAQGSEVIKYGETIARAACSVMEGQLVHVHNCHDPVNTRK